MNNKNLPVFEKEITCCFFGHRQLPSKYIRPISYFLNMAVEETLHSNYRIFISGGALGFDMLAAEAVLTYKHCVDSSIQLVIAVPCADQSAGWPLLQRKRRDSLLGSADRVVLLSDSPYYDGCMLERSRYMVDCSSRIIHYLDPRRQRGGTVAAVNYARRMGLDTFFSVYENVQAHLIMREAHAKRIQLEYSTL